MKYIHILILRFELKTGGFTIFSISKRAEITMYSEVSVYQLTNFKSLMHQ